MIAVPASAEDITAAWLNAAAPELSGVASVKAERLGEGVGMTTEIYRLTLGYGDGKAGPRTLVAKIQASIPACATWLTPTASTSARSCSIARSPRQSPCASPRCYVAAVNPETHAFALVMEDLDKTLPGDQVAGLTPAQLKVAIDQVGALHQRWWDRRELKALETRLQPFGTPPYCDFNARHAAGWETFDAWLDGRCLAGARAASARACAPSSTASPKTWRKSRARSATATSAPTT